MHRYLSITELSRIKKITSETLRHYDRINLYKPDYIDPENGYRYYSYAQCSELGTIIALKKMGISLKDIKKYIDGRSIETSKRMLGDAKTSIQEQIKELQDIERILDKSLKRIDEKEHVELMKPVIEHIGRRKVIRSNDYVEKLEDAMYSEMVLQSGVNGYYSIISAEIEGSLISADSFFDEEKRKLKRVPLILCQENVEYKINPESNFMEAFIEGGDYLCVYGKGRFKYDCEMSAFLREYIKEHKIESVGDIMELDEIDMSVTNNIDEVIYRIEIPINFKKNS